jgi:hypothetical protein
MFHQQAKFETYEWNHPPTLRFYPGRNDSVTWSIMIATFFGSSYCEFIAENCGDWMMPPFPSYHKEQSVSICAKCKPQQISLQMCKIWKVFKRLTFELY